MTQDNATQPSIAEEPHSSDLNPAMLVNPVSEKIANDTQVAEPVTEENEDEFAEAEEEEEETEDTSLEETTEAETSSPEDSSDSTSATANLPNPSVPEAEKDERSELAKQPYDFDHSTVQIAIQLLPDDGDANGRRVVVGVRTHLDTPILRFIRMNELGSLPPIVNTVLEELKAQLPAREQAAREAYEKKMAEKAKRQANTASTKTATRGKKNKLASLGASPTAGATVPDNRPRPEVKVSTAGQQQMGLF